MKNRVVNIECFYFECSAKGIRFWGHRTKDGPRYEIMILFSSLTWFQHLAVGCKRLLNKEKNKLIDLLLKIENRGTRE